MMLILHLIVALSSIACSTIALIAPSRRKLGVSYGLVALTLATGTVLVVQTHAPLLSACVSGLAYLAVVSAALVAANVRLALATR